LSSKAIYSRFEIMHRSNQWVVIHTMAIQCLFVHSLSIHCLSSLFFLFFSRDISVAPHGTLQSSAQWLGATPPALLPRRRVLSFLVLQCIPHTPFEWSNSAFSAHANFDSEGNSEKPLAPKLARRKCRGKKVSRRRGFKSGPFSECN
jgi:hypothetical protein